MRLGEKLRQAITSGFIEVRTTEDSHPVAFVPKPDIAQQMQAAAPEFVPTPEPEITPEPELDPLTPPDLTAALGVDGSLNDDVVYAQATLTPVAFTAEQAVGVLVDMAYGVTAGGRCQAMKQAISIVTDDPESAGHLVVSDAAQKMVALNKYLGTTRTELKSFRHNVAEEMEQLHERLNNLRILVDETNANFKALEEAARLRVDNLTGVIAFFDEFQSYLRHEDDLQADNASGELPAFRRDDTALKILGLESEKEAA